MNDNATTTNASSSETGLPESINHYIRVVSQNDETYINQNKPWRIVIRRQVIDGGDNNENIS